MAIIDASIPGIANIRIGIRSIASFFDDEQQVLNRLWVILLGLQALLVLMGAMSAIVQAYTRRRPRKRVTFALDIPEESYSASAWTTTTSPMLLSPSTKV